MWALVSVFRLYPMEFSEAIVPLLTTFTFYQYVHSCCWKRHFACFLIAASCTSECVCVCMCVYHIFIHLWKWTYVCMQPWTVINIGAVNTGVCRCLFGWSVLHLQSPSIETARYHGSSYSGFEGSSLLFCVLAVPTWHYPKKMWAGSGFWRALSIIYCWQCFCEWPLWVVGGGRYLIMVLKCSSH